MRSTRQAFDQQLQDLQQDLLRMMSFVEGMLQDAVQALIDQDVSRAEEVIHRDDDADQMDIDIESTCIKLLALQQPMSKDLRTISSTLKAIADLERIADYSVDIARAVKLLASEPYFKPLVDIPRIARLAQKMLRDALTAFVNRDVNLARQVCQDDDAVDDAWHALFDELVEFMKNDPRLVPQAAHLLLVTRYLERIADHVTNVAERVYYMETGRFETLARAHKTSD